MQIITTPNHFEIQFNYNPRLVQKVKELPGRRFDPVKKVWIVPSTHRIAVESFAHRNGFHWGPVSNEPSADFSIPELPDLELDIPLKMTLRHYQRTGVAYNLSHKKTIIGDDMGLGKQQPLYSKILTPDGWTTMGKIKPGDYVIGYDGNPVSVRSIHPQGVKQVYRVSFSDGSYTDCGPDHLWTVNTPTRKKRKNAQLILSLAQIMNLGISEKSGNSKFYIPIVRPVNFKDAKLPLHPYLVGALIGDGGLTHNTPRFSSADQSIIDRIIQCLPEGLSLTQDSRSKIDFTISKTSCNNRFQENVLKKELDSLGLWNRYSFEKHIPEDYLFSSVENRIELLRGLMDTDGYVNKGKRGNCTCFCTTSDRLKSDFISLVQSLGGIARAIFKNNQSRGCWVITVSMDEINPFYLERKAVLVNARTKYYPSRAIINIEYLGKMECQCISVDAQDGLYVTDDYIVTHNTGQAIATIVGADLQYQSTGEHPTFPCLVICPSSVKYNWQDQWEKWTGRKFAMILNDSNKRNWQLFIEANMAKVVIVNYESLKKYFVRSIEKEDDAKLRLNHVKFDERINLFKSVIIDESHRCKTSATQQSKFTKGICTGKEWILALTGTPVINKPKDLISQLSIINQLQNFGGYKRFIERYCAGMKEASNLKELNFYLNKYCFYRRSKQEVAKELPAKSRQVVLCDITNQKEYDDAERDLVRYLREYKNASDEKIQTAMRGQVMVQIGILKSISARGKVKSVKEYIDDAVENGEKIGIFVHLKEIATILKAHYPTCASITGDDTLIARQQSIAKFRDDPKCMTAVLSIMAAGTGVDGLQYASSTAAFIEQPWTAAACDQAEDRFNRIGQTKPVNVIYFLGRGTIDTHVYDLIQEKRNIADTVTGNTDEVKIDFVNEFANLFEKK